MARKQKTNKQKKHQVERKKFRSIKSTNTNAKENIKKITKRDNNTDHVSIPFLLAVIKKKVE